jgi:hypothetical protein
MRLAPCPAPIGQTDPAPLSLLAAGADLGASAGGVWSACWGQDDRYYLCQSDEAGERLWYRVEVERSASATTQAERERIGRDFADVIPLCAGRVAFPVGSSGRRVYRVWRRTHGTAGAGATTVLAARAGRSRRLPA